MQYQCWICPECHDDHPYKKPRTPKKEERVFMPFETDNSHIAKEYRKRVIELDIAMKALKRIEEHDRTITGMGSTSGDTKTWWDYGQYGRFAKQTLDSLAERESQEIKHKREQ